MKRLAFACTLLTAATLSAQTNTFPSSGNVGIGTVAPEAPLDVNGAIIARGLYSFIAKAPLGYWGFNHENFFAGRAGDVYGRGFSSQALGIFNGSTTGEDIFLFNRNNPDGGVLVLKASGNVGIGTTNPSSALELKSAAPYITINGTDNSQFKGIKFATNGSVQANISSNIQSGELKIQSGTSGFGAFMTFNLDDSEKLRIQANTGNVGIGTATPLAKLHVRSTGDSSQILWSGIFQNPINEGATGYGVGIRLQNGTPEHGPNEPHKWAGIAAVSGSSWSNKTDLALFTNNFNEAANSTSAPVERVRILANSGNVGIGTTNPTHKLAVNGTIKAKEIIVETTGWSDYVFADDYSLQPLAEVEAHIKTNKHLPGIPSAAQVAAEGVSLGELQAKLLAKIEELTLHQIAQQKLLNRQETRLETQSRELETLRSEVRMLRNPATTE